MSFSSSLLVAKARTRAFPLLQKLAFNDALNYNEVVHVLPTNFLIIFVYLHGVRSLEEAQLQPWTGGSKARHISHRTLSIFPRVVDTML